MTKWRNITRVGANIMRLKTHRAETIDYLPKFYALFEKDAENSLYESKVPISEEILPKKYLDEVSRLLKEDGYTITVSRSIELPNEYYAELNVSWR